MHMEGNSGEKKGRKMEVNRDVYGKKNKQVYCRSKCLFNK